MSSASLWLKRSAIRVARLLLMQFMLQGVATMALMCLWQYWAHSST